jgi:hypothetical protein
VTFWYGSGSADLYHGLTDPDLDSNPAPNLDPAFTSMDFKMPTKIIFSEFFLLVDGRIRIQIGTK